MRQQDLSKEKIQRLRDVSIHELLGLRIEARIVKIRCPVHKGGRERTASCCIYPNNSFKCWACDFKGNGAIDFLVNMGASFGEAIVELEKYTTH